MTHSVLSIRPTGVTVKLAADNPKIVEVQFSSPGLSLTLDMPRIDFETVVAKWDTLCRRDEQRTFPPPAIDLGLFKRSP
jgi:hypothetical protein